ncbi:protein phosphatase 2C domain-containing protein [Gracilibacillus salinarum]|uniref:Protein phosphatase 2C domain-containing protein n=1 Tax=Gracilibacillus salinarum TaxID=2932255 RepID=A0ABY4GK22_9BACI|nr:protein phosphatase 2C domain-containing protein [Gracilibacillus salinarum]UOQ84335.1 protein phosphatase 2C domain-containing protein [Gracilibacillus salinarum]
MKLLFSCNHKGSADFNEDVVDHHQNTAWVIDGATPLFFNQYLSEENDVVWLVQQINEQLPRFITDEKSLEEILITVLDQISQIALEINPALKQIHHYELPTFTIAMVRFIDQKLEYYVLGDSGILLETTEKSVYITDRRLDTFAEKHQDKSQTIRKHLNTRDGYWIGSLDAKGISHGLAGEYNKKDITNVLCFTDGYSRLFELYKKMDVTQMQFNETFIKDTVSMIRNIEEEDCDCLVYKRSKKSDDLSVILLENER